MRNLYLTPETKAMIKSWAKVFVAASFAVYAAGSSSVESVVKAGFIAVLPVIFTWLDPSDSRFGRKMVVKAVKKASKKAVK